MIGKLVILCMIVVIGLFCCVEQKPYEIGFSIILSGSNASFGRTIRDGFLLRVVDGKLQTLLEGELK